MKAEVKTLIENSGGRFTDADAAWLDAVPEAHLAALAAAPSSNPAPSTPNVPSTPPASTPATPSQPSTPSTPSTPATPSAPAAPTTASAITLEQLPAEYREIITEHQAMKAARKNALVNTLKTAAQNIYSEVELQSMEVTQLEKMAQLVGAATPPADFSGRGVLRDNASPESAAVLNPPNGWDEALKRRAGAVN